jgi:hypothetical protein
MAAERSRASRSICTAIVGLTAVLLLVGAATPARAATNLDTTGDWDRSTAVCQWGFPDTATYGQVITSPARDRALDSFSFYVGDPSDSAPSPSITYRAEVYAWDGNKAIGPARWEGPAKTVTLSNEFQEVKTPTRGVALAPGAQYVLFLSISKDYESNSGDAGCWGVTDAQAYSGGEFAFVNNGGDESQWTSGSWDNSSIEAAAAFKASFSTPPPVCTKGGTPGDDVIYGTPRADVICAGGGNDRVYGLGGNDTLRGQGGDDIVRGDEGDDRLAGGPGKDQLVGGPGDDRVDGGSGRDVLSGQDGRDDLDSRDGVDGNDTLNGGGDDDTCRRDLGDVATSCLPIGQRERGAASRTVGRSAVGGR